MTPVLDAELRARAEIERSPSVYFVLVEDGGAVPVLDTLYAVQLPQDTGRFRVRKDRDGEVRRFDLQFKLRGRWKTVHAAWRQLKGRNLDPAENRPVAITTFATKVLEPMGVKKWNPKK